MNGQVFFSFILCFLLSFIVPVSAFDAGDAIALILGILIGIIALCAGLGWWARRQGAA